MSDNRIPGMLIYYQNVRGLRTKSVLFYNEVLLCEHDIICLTETWLSDDVVSEELFPSEYTVFRSDRNFQLTNHSRGRGVLIASRDGVRVSRVNTDDFRNLVPNIDVVCCKVHNLSKSGKYVILMIVYIPPSISINELELFIDVCENLNCLYENDILVISDFNVNFSATALNEVKFITLNNFLMQFDMKQYSYVLNFNNRILDLVLSNFVCNVDRC